MKITVKDDLLESHEDSSIVALYVFILISQFFKFSNTKIGIFYQTTTFLLIPVFIFYDSTEMAITNLLLLYTGVHAVCYNYLVSDNDEMTLFYAQSLLEIEVFKELLAKKKNIK